jgi:1-acyl-sn-glycerol-3-phosphate acyltransferase
MIERTKRRPVSLAMFPEGTRSVDGHLLPFRKGAMKICKRAGLAVVPFAISGSVQIHRRGSLRICSGPVRISFAEPITANEVAAMSTTELHDRILRAVQDGLDGREVHSAGDDDASPRSTEVA